MAFPPFTVPVGSVTQEIVTNGVRTESPYSFKQTAYDFMGARWGATIELSVMEERTLATCLRWLASLNGSFSTFEMLAFDYAGPFGTITANPTVAAAASARAQSLSVVVVSGDALVADDRITIDGHLHVVTSAEVPLSEVQDITVWPRLRADVSIGDPVEALAPYATWALARPRNALRSNVDFTNSVTLELVEAV
ncbi:hypothetical protein [uncultured Roseobacter sp.]|uniref:hypothetical protein n=1 Tax=uncultured Roseobacter sp. TaxID=114847 RepID=UPI0026301F83|nr:hypothetical protein [uncultured Roseobacter sp.]